MSVSKLKACKRLQHSELLILYTTKLGPLSGAPIYLFLWSVSKRVKRGHTLIIRTDRNWRMFGRQSTKDIPLHGLVNCILLIARWEACLGQIADVETVARHQDWEFHVIVAWQRRLIACGVPQKCPVSTPMMELWLIINLRFDLHSHQRADVYNNQTCCSFKINWGSHCLIIYNATSCIV